MRALRILNATRWSFMTCVLWSLATFNAGLAYAAFYTGQWWGAANVFATYVCLRVWLDRARRETA